MSLVIKKIGFAPDYVDYQEALQLQKKLHAEVAAQTRQNTVLLLEHRAVITAGKRTEKHEYPTDHSVPVIAIDRGGKLTWHGPGQLVGYPILKLPEPLDVVRYVRLCEELILAVLARLGIKAEQIEGRSGVWIPAHGQLAAQKIAAIGIRVAQNTTMHGFSINCNNDLAPFSSFIPCGIQDAGVTSISQQLGRNFEPSQLVPYLEQELQTYAHQLGKDFTPTETVN